LSAYLADFQELPAEKAKPHSHAGVEFLFVMKGSLTMRVGSEDFNLEAEDAIYFDSAVQHSYGRRGSKPCSAVVVTVS
jgi:mannose-6-phosphate isomerase-like protein (cupin superfamily)